MLKSYSQYAYGKNVDEINFYHACNICYYKDIVFSLQNDSENKI